ncbi:hypothetical protein HYALB_00003627 [Hymenoscyphus albidus]|uniref:Uncharacterized protein n=1 Tax=Hymenoscyphus albidus TaxID=595503 RepID=A0A9N9M359_9HELO|nr:hypothetical protein HYALB_00003627 [Hymenoscyphus albidus]
MQLQKTLLTIAFSATNVLADLFWKTGKCYAANGESDPPNTEGACIKLKATNDYADCNWDDGSDCKSQGGKIIPEHWSSTCKFLDAASGSGS